MKHKLNMGENAVLEAVGASVTRARNFTDDVEWSAEDATRTVPDFLCRCVEVAIHSGATTINIPDTVGYSTPQEYFEIITMLRNRVPDADKVIFSTHCHNDLGLAVANSLAGVLAGARQVECTINGIGERAGNAALEEIVMALKVRKDIMPFTTNINTTLLSAPSKLVSNVTGFPVQYNKAIVGKNAFSHESGIHQDGMLKNVETYEIMRPEDVGVNATSLMLGKLSGRHAFRDKLETMGYALCRRRLRGRFPPVQGPGRQEEACLRRGYCRPGGRRDRARPGHDPGQGAQGRDRAPASSPRRLMTLSVNGEDRHVTTEGDGPVDAVFHAIRETYPHAATLQLFQINAVTEGTDAQATRSMCGWKKTARTVTGKASDTDTMVAAAYAYVNALNKLLVKREKQRPEALTIAQ